MPVPLAMPFNIAATRIVEILKCIRAMQPLLYHRGVVVATPEGIAAMPFGIATTPPYFQNGSVNTKYKAKLDCVHSEVESCSSKNRKSSGVRSQDAKGIPSSLY